MIRATFPRSGVGLWRTVAHDVWAHLPIWILFFGALGFHHCAVAMIDPSRYRVLGHSTFDFAVTALAPATCVALYFVLRTRKRPSVEHRTRAAWIVSALVLAPLVVDFVIFTNFPSLRTVMSDRELRIQFEYVTLFWVVALAFHAYRTRGAHAVVTFFLVGLLYGVVLENTGIVLGFFSEHNYTLYLWGLPAPVATMAGWSVMVYCSVWVAEQLREDLTWFKRTPLRSALLAVCVALSIDVQSDPLASLSGLAWQWNSLLPNWFLTVPFCNFAAWFGAVLPFSWAHYSLCDRADLTETQRNWRLLGRIPALAVAGGLIWLALMTIYEGGVTGPTYQILGAFFGIVPPPTL